MEKITKVLMTTTLPPKKKYNYTKKTGRPSKFDSIDKQQLKFLVLKGFTEKEISDFFGIDISTLTKWKQNNDKFFTSLKEWKIEADQQVVRSLYESAKGFRAKYKKNMVVSDGRDSGSHIETVEEEVVFAPNPTSIIFWLKNRQPKQWRDKQDVEFSGSVSWEGLMHDITGAEKGSVRKMQSLPNHPALPVL